MKSFIFASVSALAILGAGAAFAAGSTSTVTQSGVSQVANIDQVNSSAGAVSTVTQADADNHAAVTQGGSGNHASVDQSQGPYGAAHNPSNVSVSDQEGVNSNVLVIQQGNSSSSILQTGSANNEHAIVFQQNNDNFAGITQQGTNELALVNQEGSTGNSGSILQNGFGDGVDTAPHAPSGNLRWRENLPPHSGPFPNNAAGIAYGYDGAAIDQVGGANTGSINQAGVLNFADVAQGDVGSLGFGNYGAITQGGAQNHSDAIIFQAGNANISSIAQVGSGSSYSAIWVLGNSNQAYSSQTGAADNSSIEQGFTDADGTEGVATNNDYASVAQSGDNDLSEVRQSGSSNTALVSQVTNNANSLVLQSGSSNFANVHQ